VSFNNLVMHLERAEWRPTLAGYKAIIHQHLDQTLALMIAGHRTLQRRRKTLDAADQKADQGGGKDVERKSRTTDFPSQLAHPANYAGFAFFHRLYGN